MVVNIPKPKIQICSRKIGENHPPFVIAEIGINHAADRLKKMEVVALKIGSGECNNYPLVKHIASFGKPVILSTGMNDLDSISESVRILEGSNLHYALLHCTSMYPTPYEKSDSVHCLN